MKKRKAKRKVRAPRFLKNRRDFQLYCAVERRAEQAEERCAFAVKEQERLRGVIDLHDQQWRTRTAQSKHELETAKALICSIYEAIGGNQLWTLFRAIEQVVNRG